MIRSLMLLALIPAAATAQTERPIAAPPEPQAIALDTGGVTGGHDTEYWSLAAGQRSVRNVTHATLTPFLPDRRRATGAAVVVAPGGGFMSLSMDNEGWPVARWLADHGIAAFVLKYRLKPTPVAPDAYRKAVAATFGAAMKPGAPLDIPATENAIADGEAALRMVRARASGWGIDPKRIGMMGFSAGAATTLAVTLRATPATMPAFIAPIYGPIGTVAVPAGAPPMFAAMTSDDGFFAHHGFGLIDAWQAARRPVEFHLYQKGGHGFGMGRDGTTTTGWIEDFRRWLDMNHFLASAR